MIPHRGHTAETARPRSNVLPWVIFVGLALWSAVLAAQAASDGAFDEALYRAFQAWVSLWVFDRFVR